MVSKAEQFAKRFGKSAADYAYTDQLTEGDWAWEFLRRNPDYRADYRQSRTSNKKPVPMSSGATIYRLSGYQEMARKWGLTVFSNPDLNALETSVFWARDIFTKTICAACQPTSPSASDFDLDDKRERTAIAVLDQRFGQQILIRREDRAVSVQCTGQSILLGPISMSFKVAGLNAILDNCDALTQFHDLLRGTAGKKRRKPVTSATEKRTKHLVALDCHNKGASLQDTAHIFQLFNLTRLSWSSQGDETLKKQIWRSRNNGIELMQKNYRKFL